MDQVALGRCRDSDEQIAARHRPAGAEAEVGALRERVCVRELLEREVMHHRQHLARPGVGDHMRRHEEQVGWFGEEGEGKTDLRPQPPLRNDKHVHSQAGLRARRQEAPPQIRSRGREPLAYLAREFLRSGRDRARGRVDVHRDPGRPGASCHVDDLKLTTVRHVAARAGVVVVLLAAAGYLLQAGDSMPKPYVSPAPQPQQALSSQPPVAGPVYLISHDSVVPLGARSIRLPILMYHYIRTPPSTRTDPLGYRLSVSPIVFQSQMDWLSAHGYHAITFNQVRAYFAGTSALPAKPVVISVDDGHADLYTTAFPILQSHHFTAVAYIVSGFINRAGYVTSDEVVQLDRAGIEIGSHTVSHPDLAHLSFASAMFQVVESKRVLEGLVGHPVVDFAYPSGRYDAETVEALVKAGYDTAVTTADYPVAHSLQNRYTWSRVRVTGGEPLPAFITSLGPSMHTVTTTHLSLVLTPFEQQLQT